MCIRKFHAPKFFAQKVCNVKFSQSGASAKHLTWELAHIIARRSVVETCVYVCVWLPTAFINRSGRKLLEKLYVKKSCETAQFGMLWW